MLHNVGAYPAALRYSPVNPRNESTPVSELIAFVFRDQYRAPEVLNELRRRDWVWVQDLEEAVAVTVNDDAKVRIHLSVDPSTLEAAVWARLWGTLLGKTLFLPLASKITEVVNGISTASVRSASAHSTLTEEAQWWQETLDLSADFKRDVAAVMSSGGSAIFMLLREAYVTTALSHLRDYGDTIIHTSVSNEQDNKMLAMLAN